MYSKDPVKGIIAPDAGNMPAKLRAYFCLTKARKQLRIAWELRGSPGDNEDEGMFARAKHGYMDRAGKEISAAVVILESQNDSKVPASIRESLKSVNLCTSDCIAYYDAANGSPRCRKEMADRIREAIETVDDAIEAINGGAGPPQTNKQMGRITDLGIVQAVIYKNPRKNKYKNHKEGNKS